MSPDDEQEASAETRALGGLVRHSAIYSVAPLLRQFISIGMHRLYTRWLGEPGVGVKETVDFWLIALQQLLGINVLGAMVRFYYDQKNPEDRGRVVTSSTILIGLVAWIVCGTALFFSPSLVTPMLGKGGEVAAGELGRILQIALILIPFQLSSMSGFYYLQILRRSKAFTTIQSIKLLVEVGFNFLFIGHLQLGVYGFLLSMLIGESLTSLGLCGWIFVTLKPRFNWRVLRPILVYAWPLVPVGLCQLVLHFADRRLLLELSGDDGQRITGIYGHGYKIAFLVTNMLLGPFLQIWQPWIFAIENAKERSALIARVGTYAVLTIAAASLGVILFGRQGAILLAEPRGFWVAYKAIPWISAGYVFWALYHVAQTVLFVTKRTGRIFTINIVAVGINLIANLYLIPIYGFEGAAMATLLTFVAIAAMMVVAARAESQVPFENRRLATILGCVLIAGAFSLWIDGMEAAGDLSMWLSVPIKAGFYAMALGLFWIAVLAREEKKRFRRWLLHELGRRA
ncbi:MAG: hypothetical protein CMJ89_09360 [Planctomycetes bacterium]|nr:hypothetical protein [Planctomycetota bacterium]